MASRKKHKTMPTGMDLIALGAGSSSSSSNPASVNYQKFPQKRPEVNAPMNLAIKKPKIQTQVSVSKIANWEEKAIIMQPNELIQELRRVDRESYNQEEYIIKLLCGAAKLLRDPKTELNGNFIMNLIYIAKTRPLDFCGPIVVEAFSSLLRKDFIKNIQGPSKGRSIVPSLVINLFLNAFHDESSWPEQFINMFLEDSLGDRVWVDSEDCKDFVEILIETFHTKLPKKGLLQTAEILNPKSSDSASSSSTHLPSFLEEVDEASCSSNPSTYSDHSKDGAGNTFQVYSRYEEHEQEIHKRVYTVIENVLTQRNMDLSRGILRLLMATSGMKEIRTLVSQRLESWFQNPKLCRPAQDLMMTVFINCTAEDIETISTLFKMKLKTKIIFNHFVNCLKSLINKDDNISSIIMKNIFASEMESPSNFQSSNSQIMIYYFQIQPEKATRLFAQFCFEKMITLDVQQIHKIRSFIRDNLLRQLRNEHFNHELFLLVLFEETSNLAMKPEFVISNLIFRSNIVHLVADFVVMIQFLMITTTVRDSFTTKSNKRDVRRYFQNQIASIQSKSVQWIVIVGKDLYKCEKAVLIECLTKVVFHDSFAKGFTSIDLYSNENERQQLFYMLSNVPVHETTLSNVLTIFESDGAITPGTNRSDSIHFCYQLITRAALIYDGDEKNPVIILQNPKAIVDRLFENSVFVFSMENTEFPSDYIVPKFAMIDVYSRVWTIVVILAAHNSMFGKEALKYPTFMLLIEMAITNNFQCNKSSQELQYEAREKIELFQFESYLGKKEINEANSYLLNHLVKLDPFSIARTPFLKALEDFKQDCGRLFLGNFLCQNRDPDFLKIIIEKQKNLSDSQSSSAQMPWLTNLVEMYEDKYEFLPVPALCQYLFGQIVEDLNNTAILDSKRRLEKRRKQIKLIGFFQGFVLRRSKSQQDAQLFEHLFSRLSSSNSLTRTLAFKTLHMIFTVPVNVYLENLEENSVKPLVSETNDTSWLQFVTFQSEHQRTFFLQSIEKTLMVETDPKLIVDYIVYLANVGKGNIQSINVHLIACSFTTRQRLYDHIIVYSNHDDIRTKFLNSMLKIFSDYLLFLETLTNFPAYEDQLWLKINGKTISMTIPIFQTYLLLLPLIEMNKSNEFGNVILTKFLSGMKLPQVCRDLKMKKVFKYLSEKKDVWIVVKMLRSNTKSLIDIILSNLTLDFILQEIVFRHGMSNIAMDSIMKLLDANATKISTLTFNRPSLLQVFETQWSLGIRSGHEFARINLSYKKDEPTVEMDVTPVAEAEYNNEIVGLSRLVLAEFFSANNDKKFEYTKKFLQGFNKNISRENICKGTYNSLFNIICIQCHRRPNDLRTIVMPEIGRIQRELDSEKYLHDTVFYKVLQEFNVFIENKEKSLPKDDETEVFEYSRWNLIQEDLIVEKTFTKNTDLVEKYKKNFKQILFHRQRPYIHSEMLLKTSTTSIYECFKYFTNDDMFESIKNNPNMISSILDFIELYYDSPKMILSLETIKSKKDQQLEDILAFNEQIIKKILQFVIIENRIPSRIGLVLKTCCVTSSKITITRKYLQNLSSLNDVSVKNLQMQLYKKLPAFQQPDDMCIEYLNNESNYLDKIGHHLISAVTFWENLQNVSDQRFEVWELTLIVMAKRHPYLIARQIPILADIFQGFVITKSFETFKERKMLKILSAILDFLNTISNKIQLSECDVNKITKILTFYQTLFHEHHHKSDQLNFELSPLWDKYKRFIDTLIGRFLPFSEFGKWFIQQDFTKLDRIFNSLPFTIPERWFLDYERVETIFKKRHKSESEKQDFELFKQFIERNSAQSTALNNSSNIVNKKPAKCSTIKRITNTFGDKNLPIPEYITRIKRMRIIPQIDGDIFRKIVNSPGLIEFKYRSIMDILMIYFRYNDDTTKRGISLYLSMLDSHDEGIRNVAFQYLPQVTLLQPEYRYSLIRRAFYRTLSRKMGAEDILMNTFGVINDSLF